MNQADASVGEAIIVAAANVDLVQDAARDLEDFIEEAVTPGHWPSWFYRLPDGFALCIGCWRVITARQLDVESCLGARPERRAVSTHKAASQD